MKRGDGEALFEPGEEESLAGLSGRERLALRRARARERPTRATVAAILAVLLGLLLIPNLLLGIGLFLERFEALPSDPRQLLLLPALMGIGLVCGAIGLLRVGPLGWWITTCSVLVVQVDQLRILLPLLLALNPDHPRYTSSVLTVLAVGLLPILLGAAILVSLAPRSVREVYGVAARARVRDRRTD